MPKKSEDSITVSPILLEVCLAAIAATQAWSKHQVPLADLDPAMERLRTALGPVLGFPQVQTAPPPRKRP